MDVGEETPEPAFDVSFRQRLMVLASEYERVQADNQRLRDLLPRTGRSDGSDVEKKEDYPSNASTESVGLESAGTRSERIRRRNKTSKLTQGYEDKLASSSSRFAIRRWASAVVQKTRFEEVTAAVIMLNVLYIGWAADKSVSNPRKEGLAAWRSVVEAGFCGIYVIELGIRALAYGKSFLKPPDRGWNLFDSLLVVQSLYEQLSTYTNFAKMGSGNLSFMRTMRLLKLLKVLRMIRLMRAMRELRMIMFAIMGSIKGMFWSIVLTVCVLYMFALVFVQGIAFHFETESDIDPLIKESIVLNFGSMGSAMISMFSSITGGVDWNEVADPLRHVGASYYATFCLFIAFFIFVVLNTITALFVETTLQNANLDFQSTIQTELEKVSEYKRKIRTLFEEMDEGGVGLIHYEAFISRMTHPRMLAFAASLGIEISDAHHFFSLLSDQGRKQVDLDTFVTGCIRMRGTAQSIDVLDLVNRQKMSLAEQERFNRLCEVRFHSLETLVKSAVDAVQHLRHKA
mmetsp:Transcript_105885/g.297726  ORF Transcript_105885/g.297726 Transcript_105885/m.297726 type:complete len:515 (-) Transcript_105885:178-1722(-)|eukprot:CAMPEP_0117535722 /NCGR_PEP_ID=MMETSP0784-20121206/41081_1 /TAXON_ID=39447 /ORGANISM="" /LENGTH=514 /DNA_ID=CAMNT_0005332257 /DNA_START=41 /DNA_END=1585 /DNA_ORIENTATION=-